MLGLIAGPVDRGRALPPERIYAGPAAAAGVRRRFAPRQRGRHHPHPNSKRESGRIIWKRPGSAKPQQSPAAKRDSSLAERAGRQAPVGRGTCSRLTSRRSPVRARHRPSGFAPRKAAHSRTNRTTKRRLWVAMGGASGTQIGTHLRRVRPTLGGELPRRRPSNPVAAHPRFASWGGDHELSWRTTQLSPAPRSVDIGWRWTRTKEVSHGETPPSPFSPRLRPSTWPRRL